MNYTYFFTESSPFSQWYRCTFTDPRDGVTYNCAEQYMMHCKALLFEDHESAEAVLRAAHPRQQKALGRRVRNFDQIRWLDRARHYVYEGNYLKFHQNNDLWDALLATRPTTLVEASPYDCLWGIGLAASDPRALDPAKWRGKNWLGQVLTELRDAMAI